MALFGSKYIACGDRFRCWLTLAAAERPQHCALVEFFFAQSKSTIILGLLSKFGEIISTLGHYMTDSLSFEIYSSYIGFTQYHRGAFTKIEIFFERILGWPQNFTEIRQIGKYEKSKKL